VNNCKNHQSRLFAALIFAARINVMMARASIRHLPAHIYCAQSILAQSAGG
jgi:hypothetical protein